MPLSEPSRAWPWIKRIAKAVAGTAAVMSPPVGIPAGIAVTLLTDLQDDLGKTKPQEKSDLKQALAAIQQDTAAIVQQLHAEHPELLPDRLRETARGIAEALYLKNLADEFFYADFKGIEQLERFVSLELDEIFVNLKARPERRSDDPDFPLRLAEKEVLLAKLKSQSQQSWLAARKKRMTVFGAERIDAELDQLDRQRFLTADRRPNPVSIDYLLRHPGGVVLLGGPGSGKTTLVKRVARSCALGTETLKQRYPELPRELSPVVVSITLFDDTRGSRDITAYGVMQYVEEMLDERWGPALVEAFRERWAAGQCLLLLDGLDEVADEGRRIGAARAVDGLLQQLGHNRVVVTSRIIGYSICRLSVPADHATLEPFSPEDVATFALQWHRAYDRAAHPQSPRPEQADRDADALIDDIRKNPRVADLATNPLMMTIIALIKHQEVTLPDRRVELYAKALNTLIHSWNKARSLSGRPVGETPRLDATKKVWSAVALWMHEHASRGTLRRQQLHDKLVEVLQSELGIPELAASEIAESYLLTATESSGLLEARGQDRFAFVHQTFQEYLAAIRLATLCRKTMDPLRSLIDNPRWHEVIRLAAGFIGVYVVDNEQLSELIQTLFDEARDPLEPYLLTGLRLASSCIADDVGFRQCDSDPIVERLFDRAVSPVFEPLRDSLLETSLPSVKTAPGPQLREKLITVCEQSHDWRLRLQGARLLGLVRPLDAPTRQCLDLVLTTDRDADVRAYAALGLWQSRARRDERVVCSVLHGLSSDIARIALPPDNDLLPALVRLLEDENAHVRIRAAKVLYGWGHQDTALPALVRLLEQGDDLVRLRAAVVAGNWRHHEKAVPTLVGLLEHDDAKVGSQAAEVLSGWRPIETVRPALIRMLEHKNADVRFRAVAVLGGWGIHETALPALIQRLADKSASVRIRAAKVLGCWEPYETALPALVGLLEHEGAYVVLRAAEVLGGWGHPEKAIPAVVRLLRLEDVDMRLRAAEILGGWGHPEKVIDALLRLLEREGAYERLRVVQVLGGWGTSAVVVTKLLKLMAPRSKQTDREAAAVWLMNPNADGFHSRPPQVSDWLAKQLKPQPRDSALKRALREVVYHWVWQACGAY